jgi:hypothetical protein
VKSEKDSKAFEKKVYDTLARSQGKLPPPDVGINFKCECGLWLSTRLGNFNPFGGKEVMCAQCGAVTFLPPEILDHDRFWKEFQSATLKDDWQQLIKIAKHGRKD